MTARDLWLIGLCGPLVAYALVGLVGMAAALLAQPLARTVPDEDTSVRGSSWLVLGIACGFALAAADATVALVIGVTIIDRVALAGLLAGLACGPPGWVAVRLVILPLPALVIPFVLNLLALWVMAC